MVVEGVDGKYLDDLFMLSIENKMVKEEKKDK